MSIGTLFRWILGSVFFSLGFGLQAGSLVGARPPRRISAPLTVATISANC